MIRMFMFCALLAGTTALANGQSTHLWITQHALTHLPPGELHDLLSRDELGPMLMNGSMFPDGGYAIFDDYGEIAHWEPFHDDYLQWILDNEPPPFSDEGAQHVTFLMGLASHGMADQLFDALFMERSKIYDDFETDQLDSLDTASDVLLVAATAPQDVPPFWTPTSLFVDLFADREHFVTADTINGGQTRLAAALVWVALMSEMEEQVAGYTAQYPWTADRLLDDETPGAPPCEGEVIARYWQVLWERLHDGYWPDFPLLATFPEDGYSSHPVEAERVESRISLVFSRGLSADELSAASFRLVAEGGDEVPVEPWLFYGDGSHIVHLSPLENLQRDTAYTVVIAPGVEGRDGLRTESEIVLRFRTESDNLSERRCGCTSSGSATSWLSGGVLLVMVVRRRSSTLRSSRRAWFAAA